VVVGAEALSLLEREQATTLAVKEDFLLLMVEIHTVEQAEVEVEALTVPQRVLEDLLSLTAFQQVGTYTILQYQGLAVEVVLEQ
jgi:hypothetical protein